MAVAPYYVQRAPANRGQQRGTDLDHSRDHLRVKSIDFGHLNARPDTGFDAVLDATDVRLRFWIGAFNALNLIRDPEAGGITPQTHEPGSSDDNYRLIPFSDGEVEFGNALLAFKLGYFKSLQVNPRGSGGQTLQLGVGTTIDLGSDGVGTSGQVLTSAGASTTPTWEDAAGGPDKVWKAADQSVTNTTPQNDTHLLQAVAANEERAFRLVLFRSDTGAAFEFNFSGPTGATVRYGFVSVDTAGAMLADYTETAADLLISAAGPSLITIDGVILNGANAGNLQFRWGNNSGLNAATLRAFSYMTSWELA